MPVTGDPRELRALAVAAKRAAADMSASFRQLDNKHHVTRYNVPNKHQVDDLYRQASAKIKAAADALTEIERRMNKIAVDLEQVNK